jgi:HEAT repeat protein
LLDDPRAETRAIAISVLRQTRASSAWREIGSKLSTDQSEIVRIEAAKTLGEFDLAESTNILMHSLRDRSVSVRVYAIASLGQVHDPRATSPLSAILVAENSDPREIEAACVALGSRKASEARGDLLAVARNHDHLPKVRAAAIFALGQLGGDVAAREVLNALEDDSAVVRFNAVMAVQFIGRRDFADRIAAVFLNPKEENFVRIRAGWVLRAFLGNVSMAALRSVSEGQNEFMAMHAVVILATISQDGFTAARSLRQRTTDAFVASTMDKLVNDGRVGWEPYE